MKIVKMAVLIVLSALAMNCGDKPPQDPSTSSVIDPDAAAPASTDPVPASTNK